MTPSEFKAWFEGFTEAVPGVPTKAQWARLVAAELGLPDVRLTDVDPKAAGQWAPRPQRVGLLTTRHQLTHPPLASILHRLRSRLIR